MIRSFRDLEAWKLGMDFVTSVYVVTRTFPKDEVYGLSAQLRRAAVAIPSNISEGHQHPTRAFVHYVTIALGSLAECETQLDLAKRLELASEADIAGILTAAVSSSHVARPPTVAETPSLIPDP